MTKQEMAEWLAEKVLGWVLVDYCYRDKHSNQAMRLVDGLVEFIYSPDGFFAVWDAVEKKAIDTEHNFFMNYQCDLSPDYSKRYLIGMIGQDDSFGKDRYEAFYNAVYEAFKV